MRKNDPSRSRKARSPFRGNKGAPVKARINRAYGRGLINDHLRDDTREDKYLHAHARRRRAATQENHDAG